MLLQINFSLSASGGLTHVPADRPGIGLRPLAVDRKAPHMANAAICLDILQTRDVLLQHLPKLSLYLVSRFDLFLQLPELVLGQLFRPFVRIDAQALQDALRRYRADAINIGERNSHLLLIRNVYTYKTHINVLSLPLLMLRRRIAQNIDTPFPTNDLALSAYFLD